MRLRVIAILLGSLVPACSRSILDGGPADETPVDGSVDGSIDSAPNDDASDSSIVDATQDDADSGDAAGPTDAIADRDGDADAGACGTDTCRRGCCDSSGRCQPGTGDEACGAGGATCDLCSGDFHCAGPLPGFACVARITDCNPGNCTTGCCGHIDSTSSAVFCFSGAGDTACGVGGQVCSDCTAVSLTCQNHVCGRQSCGSSNCSDGCCLGNECVSGTDQFACGMGGALCRDCSRSGATCQLGNFSGGVCRPPACTPDTCSGCCVKDVCAVGTQDSACGTRGVACANCLTTGTSCDGGHCE